MAASLSYRKIMAKEKNTTGFAIAVVALLALCVPYMYYAVLLHNYGMEHKPEGFNFPEYKDYWKTLVGAVVCQLVRVTVRYLTIDWCYQHAKNKDNEQARIHYAEKASKKLYQAIYYLVSSTWGWYVLKDSMFLPWYLGGHKDANYINFVTGTPFTIFDPSVLDYAQYTLGYYVGDLVFHTLFDARNPDFYEMLLHHIATVTLIVGSSISNLIGIGTVIAYLHDLADFPGQIARFADAAGLKRLAEVSFFVTVVVWFWTRNICLAEIIYFIT